MEGVQKLFVVGQRPQEVELAFELLHGGLDLLRTFRGGKSVDGLNDTSAGFLDVDNLLNLMTRATDDWPVQLLVQRIDALIIGLSFV